MENYQLDMIRSGGVFLTEEVEKAIFKRSEKIKALPLGEMKALPFPFLAKKICFSYQNCLYLASWTKWKTDCWEENTQLSKQHEDKDFHFWATHRLAFFIFSRTQRNIFDVKISYM